MSTLKNGKYSITDLIDIENLAQILEAFSAATGFTTGFVEQRTKKVLISTGWHDICAKFHRADKDSAVHCKSSNKKLFKNLNTPGQVNIEQCDNGLIDGATPIIIKGEHLANLASGQIFFKQPDLEFFRKQAEQYGYDIEAYLEAVKKVPIVSESRFKNILKFLSMLATVIAALGLSDLASKDKINTLSGLLPICLNCKKIRDDKGYWAQIESYIESHSDAQFSHGLCEECAEKLYGDQTWYNK